MTRAPPGLQHVFSVSVMDDDVLVLPSGRFRVRRDGKLIRALGLRYATARRFEPCVPLPVT